MASGKVRIWSRKPPIPLTDKFEKMTPKHLRWKPCLSRVWDCPLWGRNEESKGIVNGSNTKFHEDFKTPTRYDNRSNSSSPVCFSLSAKIPPDELIDSINSWDKSESQRTLFHFYFMLNETNMFTLWKAGGLAWQTPALRGPHLSSLLWGRKLR